MTSPRRTFAIISHPDAGKTTLTEKLLYFGGAIHLAGEVKARGANRRARSDWMKIEQQRGISVTSSVMTFEREGVTFNLLDTPGHEDFSEDTYRTLTAVDSAVMVIDVAKGIESQTRKLFEVCRLRNVPIITFVNKVDREGRPVFETLDEVADLLQLDVTPMTWPVTNRACSERRNTITSATSSASPSRPSAVSATRSARPLSSRVSSMSVAMKPGSTALTRMPCGPSSLAADLASAATAALDAA